MRKSGYFIFPLLILLLAAACRQKPKEALSRGDFVALYSRMLVIQKLPVPEKERIVRIKKLLKEYHISEEQFLAQKERHKDDVDFWLDVYKQSRDRLEEQIQEIYKKRKERKATKPKPKTESRKMFLPDIKKKKPVVK